MKAYIFLSLLLLVNYLLVSFVVKSYDDDGGTILLASTLNKVCLSDIHNFVKQK